MLPHDPVPNVRLAAPRWRSGWRLVQSVIIAAVFATAVSADEFASVQVGSSKNPDFGPNVKIFDPSMPTTEIQAVVDAIAAEQVDNQFGPQRYALLFKPGTYGTAASPLTFQVGYYTDVAGLGASPTEVTINGHVDVYNRCSAPDHCIALDNFWRSLSNLTINVMGLSDCRATANFWAVSQASPIRRVHITGSKLSLMDYCSGPPQYASGGFMADSHTGSVVNGSQQQFLVRSSIIADWSNGVWNQVFSGVVGAPPQSFSTTPTNPPPYTTLDTSPVTREKPFVFVDRHGDYHVFVPALRRHSMGPSWTSGHTSGHSIPIRKFFIAKPTNSVAEINMALARGQNLIFTPGIYQLDGTIEIKRARTVVLGLGFPTLVPNDGVVAMTVADVPGVKLAGLLFDAGPVNSPVLLEVGTANAHWDWSRYWDWHNHGSDPADPTSLQDVFFRIGGATAGKATTSLVVNSNHVLLDDIWAWRADHGNGVGWTVNTADTGLIVNGNHVTAYGLFVGHYQKYQVIWNGEHGRTIMFQNEMPYDPPNQAAWMRGDIKGYPAYKVADSVRVHEGWGLGSYCFFNVDPSIHAARGFEVPRKRRVVLHDVLTISLGGMGVIDRVVNDTGAAAEGPATIPVNLVRYP